MASPRTSLAIARLCSDLPSNLPTLVASRFDEARQKGALTLSGISVRTVRCGNVPFLLQYCPALSKKPTPGQEKKQKQENTEPKGEETENEGQAKEKPQQKKKFNPFENPDPNLVISDVPLTSPAHYLILNKFPIISGHFILATKECKPQTHFLEKSDLEVAFAVLKAWELRSNTQQRRSLFAFFNSGEHSGASQPHRHIQFLPTENMQFADTEDWTPLIERLRLENDDKNGGGKNDDLPFTYHAIDISKEGLTGEELHAAYLKLFAEALGDIKVTPDQAPVSEGEDFEDQRMRVREGRGPTEISYNLAMTTTRMAICARVNEGAEIPLPEGGSGEVKLNGTLFAGTVLVKEKEEFEAMLESPQHLRDILGNIGVKTAGHASL